MKQILIGCVLWIIVSDATAIVNLEKLHLNQNKVGFSSDVSVALSGAIGNSNRFRTKSTVNAQWNSTSSAKKEQLYYLSFDYRYGESDGTEDQNKGFFHARKIENITNTFAWEIFSQVEQNKFARLNFRGLFGGGIRYDFNYPNRNYVTFLGLGGFYSREDIAGSAGASDSGLNDVVRTNIYLLQTFTFQKNITVFETLYIQPSINDVNDTRLLNIVGLKTQITAKIATSLSIELVYDNQPPQFVKKQDVSYFTSIAYKF